MCLYRKHVNKAMVFFCAVFTLLRVETVAASDYLALGRGVNVWGVLTMPLRAPYFDASGRGPYGQYQSGAVIEDFPEIRRQGFDFIRLPVDPTPYFYVSPDRRELVLKHIESVVKSAVEVGLRVVVDIHPPVSGFDYSSEKIVNSFFGKPDKAVYDSYKAFLLDLTKGLKSISAEMLWIEPLNEPWVGCDAQSVVLYSDFFNDIAGSIRKVNSEFRIVYGGPCNSSWRTLVMLDPESIKIKGVVYTFHFYEPFLFTHQGASWRTAKKHLRYLGGVPFPYNEEKALDARMRAEGSALDSKLSSEEKRVVVRDLNEAFQGLKGNGSGDVVTRAFGEVEKWRRANRISLGSVFVGEFGTIRSSYISGPREIDRGNWYKAVRQASENAGFGWAVWEYADAMGIVNSGSDRRVIPSINSALGLSK